MTLETDVERRLREYARRSRKTFKDAVNSLLKKGLAAQDAPARRRRFRVEPHRSGFRPGVDPAKLRQLDDQLQTEGFVRKSRGA